MPKYLVKDGHKKHDGKLYAPGDMIECAEDVARQLRLEPVKKKRRPAKKNRWGHGAPCPYNQTILWEGAGVGNKWHIQH